MIVRAQLNFLHQSPRKVRQVAATVRGADVAVAEAQLMAIDRRAGLPLKKLLQSAVANAVHNWQLEPGNLYVKEIRVNEGPVLKRFRPRAFGRAAPIRKRSAHILVVLDERVPTNRAASRTVASALPEPIVAPGTVKAESLRGSAEKGGETRPTPAGRRWTAPFKKIKEKVQRRTGG